MRPFKIILLVGAAVLGTLYYNRFSALSNIVGDSEIPVGASSTATPYEPSGRSSGRMSSGTGGIGGIGSGSGRTYSTGRHDSGSYMSGRGGGAMNGGSGSLALMEAAAKGDNAKIKTLLEKSADVNGRDSNRRTPLMFASWNGQAETCIKLLSAGANVRAQDRDNNDALDYAASRGHMEIIQTLLDRTDIKDDKHAMEHATIIRAIYAGDTVYLPAGKLYSVNRISPEGSSPLHLTAGSGLAAFSEELLKRGAQINLENEGKQTPLHWAAWYNQPQVVALLLSKGADMGKKDAAGNTPLLLAAQHNSIDAAKILLEKGARKKEANKQGKTALTIAEDNGNQELIALLK